MGSEFDADTQVEYAGPGEYAATITDRWHALAGPNGGYLLGVCLQALTAEMPQPDPLVVSAYYLRGAQVGPATVQTEVIRSGRRTASGQASLLQDGKESLRVLATYSDLDRAEGRTVMLNEPPALPPPEDCIDPMTDDALPGFTIVERVQARFARTPGWFRGEPGHDPRMEFWARLADGREPDLLTLPLMVDAAPPVVLDFGERGSITLELTVHLRAKPVPGWLACRVTTRHVQAGFHEEDFEIWDSAGTLVAQSRQLALLP